MSKLFRTPVIPGKTGKPINHNTSVLIMGSCFAENIGHKLLNLRFNVDLNPFGIMFNPMSVAKSIEMILDEKLMKEDMLILHNDYWHSLYHHSKFSNKDKEQCIKDINERIKTSGKFIKNADYIIITFGTAWVYYYNNQVVSNCHKIPTSHFERKLLTVDDIVKIYTKIIESIKQQNSRNEIILTVSPIRHLRDGAHGNQVSKSILILAANELCNKKLATYFPSYEIMLDDLRDYRFYNSDMVHPSEIAIEYIFERFSDSYFNEDTKELNSEIIKILASVDHKPIKKDTTEHKNFINGVLERIKNLNEKFPELDFSKEIQKLNTDLGTRS